MSTQTKGPTTSTQDAASTVEDKYYEDYMLDVWLEENRGSTREAEKKRQAALNKAIEKNRIPAHPARMHDGEWGVRISHVSGGEDFQIGEEVEVQVIAHAGRTWPATAVIEHVCYGSSFGRTK